MIRLDLLTNIVVLTLAEKTTIANPKYLFEFINNQTQQTYYCIATDSSLYPCRYNQFTITVQTTTPNPLLGQINIPLGDEYTYNIYQQTSSTNLDPTLSMGVVESGLMTYDKTISSRVEYTPASQTRKAYEP
jgi:hypothetical protein